MTRLKPQRATNHNDTIIGNRIRQARLSQNLTQSDLAERLGLSFQQVQKYETGSNRISSSRLWLLAKILNLPITFFFSGLQSAGISASGFRTEDALPPDAAIRVARMLNELPDGPEKTSLVSLVNAVVDSKEIH